MVVVFNWRGVVGRESDSEKRRFGLLVGRNLQLARLIERGAYWSSEVLIELSDVEVCEK